jgi:hypothetical protein
MQDLSDKDMAKLSLKRIINAMGKTMDIDQYITIEPFYYINIGYYEREIKNLSKLNEDEYSKTDYALNSTKNKKSYFDSDIEDCKRKLNTNITNVKTILEWKCPKRYLCVKASLLRRYFHQIVWYMNRLNLPLYRDYEISIKGSSLQTLKDYFEMKLKGTKEALEILQKIVKVCNKEVDSFAKMLIEIE